MNKPICYVGIDVGKTELWVAIANRRPREFVHTAAGVRALVRFCRKVMPEHVLHFCLEATGSYSRSLVERLLKYSDVQASIVNPMQIKAFGKAQLRRTKTDAVDARVILAFAQSQRPRTWTREPAALRELSQLVRVADDLQATRAQWSNRQQTHALLSDQPAAVRHTERALLRSLDGQLTRLHKAIKTLCERDPVLCHQIALLCSIPGVAELSATRFLAYGRCAWTTHSGKELTAHAGLAPRHRLSGTSVRGKSHLAKQGDARLRGSLYMPAMVGSRYNPALKLVYERLRKAGKPGKLALAACMRHLLLIARAVLRNNQPFDPKYTSM